MIENYIPVATIIKELQDHVELDLKKGIFKAIVKYDIDINEKELMKAIEKQIPKTPALEGDGYSLGELVIDIWYCPNCDTAYELDYHKYKYCPNCGQRIEWGGQRESEGEEDEV